MGFMPISWANFAARKGGKKRDLKLIECIRALSKERGEQESVMRELLGGITLHLGL